MKKKLAIISTHPIQYYAPWFKMLAERKGVNIKVFYTWSQAYEEVEDKNFGRKIKWDIPLLDGYDYEFINNVSKKPGTHHFFGINCPDLINKVSSYKPDVILVFGWNFISHLKLMRYFKGKIPIWFRGDSTLLDEESNIKTRLRRVVLSLVYKYVDKAFYVGSNNRLYFLKHGLRPNQLVFAPHAIDNERFGASKNIKSSKSWRDELGFKEEDNIVLFAGKFEEKKQPTFLLKCLMEANKKNNPKLHLLLVGNGHLKNKLKSIAKDYKYVQFLPFQNQSKMPDLYKMANIFCLPSKGPGETWGLAVNEAMACAKPIIVSNKVGCSTDLVKEGLNGWVIDYGDEEELRRILSNLNNFDLEKMGNQSLEIIKDYSFETIVNVIEEEILSLN